MTTYGLVTGANRGLGLALLAPLLTADPTLHIFMGTRSIDSGTTAVQTLPSEFRHRVTPVALDVTDATSLSDAFGVISKKSSSSPSLALLINNAGVLGESESASDTLSTNYFGAISTTEKFLPLLTPNATVLFTSSSCGTRFLGSLPANTRESLLHPSLTTAGLTELLTQLPQDDIYSVSKCAVNVYTLILSRANPSMLIKAVSPGFTNTGMCANYSGSRVPKSPELGATVFSEAIYGVGKGLTGVFVKQNDKAGVEVGKAQSVLTEFATDK
jgi:NAD(P)-dependent dehydrogenase (short-subunit alcohol dehydrogenase family)